MTPGRRTTGQFEQPSGNEQGAELRVYAPGAQCGRCGSIFPASEQCPRCGEPNCYEVPA